MLLHVPTTSSTTPAHESLDRDFLRFVAQLPTLCDDLSVPETQLMLSQTRGNSGDSDHSTADHAVQVPALTSLTGDCYHLDATPAWNPTPSAPEYYREELTRKLADLEGLLPDSSSTLVQQHDTAIAEDLEAANAGAPLGLMPDHDSLERKRATNRKAQKVFRAKRKGRAQAVEIQLANTVQELEELKLNQQQLMRKNLILQNMCKEGNCQPPEDADIGRQQFGEFEASNTARGRGLVMTIQGRIQSISMQDLAVMELPEFAKLWTAYISELATLLVQLGSAPQDMQLRHRLDQVTFESSQLMGIIKPNLKVYKAVLEGRLDEGRVGEDAGSGPHLLDSQWYARMPELVALSDSQIQDFCLLRKLYLTKRSLLAAERERLIRELHMSSSTSLRASDTLAKVLDFSAQLRQNAAEDYLAYIKVACAARRGLLSTEQWASVIVFAYPCFCSLETVLEIVAYGCGDPSRSEVLEAAQHHPLTEEWRCLDLYLLDITQKQHSEYIPLYRPKGITVFQKNQPPTSAALSHMQALLM